MHIHYWIYTMGRFLLSVSRSNFPFLCSNIPAAPAYGVYISQLICYSRACCRYGGCLIRNRRCLLYRCTWPRSWFLFGSLLLRHVYFGSCVVLVCCLCLYLCFQSYVSNVVIAFRLSLVIEADKQKATKYKNKLWGDIHEKFGQSNYMRTIGWYLNFVLNWHDAYRH